MIDSRSRRVVRDGKRLMADEAEWRWVTESVTGDWEHVVLATSVPLLLPRGIHGLEAWTEAVCDGAWGRRFARVRGAAAAGARPGALAGVRPVVRASSSSCWPGWRAG